MVDSIVAQDTAEFNTYLAAARNQMRAKRDRQQREQRARYEAEQAERKANYEAAYRVAQAALPAPLRSRLLLSADPQEWRSSPFNFFLDLIGHEGAPLWLSVSVDRYGDGYQVTNYSVYFATHTWLEDERGIDYKQTVITPSNYHIYNDFETALEAALRNMDTAAASEEQFKLEYQANIAKAEARLAEMQSPAQALPENGPPASHIVDVGRDLWGDLSMAADWADQDQDLRTIYIVLKVIAKALLLSAEREV